MRKVSVYKFKQCHIIKRLNEEIQKEIFSSFTPLTTVHCHGYVLLVALIIDCYMFGGLLPRKDDLIEFFIILKS
jgi:hypothetical protein